MLNVQCSIELPNDEVSDTTDDDSSTEAGYIKKILISHHS
jgi:hypothetical protein